jgi:hypothetical protein
LGRRLKNQLGEFLASVRQRMAPLWPLIDNGRSSVQTWGGYPIINDQSKTRFGQKIDAGDKAVISRVALQLKIKKMSFWIYFFSMKFQSGNAQFLQSIQIAKI